MSEEPEIILKPYPDTTYRKTYPPLPSRGKPTNVPIAEAQAAIWAANAAAAARKADA